MGSKGLFVSFLLITATFLCFQVTNINHGGPVTFVSVNNGEDSEWHQQQTQTDLSSSFQGSHTLPRAGRKRDKRSPQSQTSNDDSDVVITRRMSSEGNSSVRIQIGTVASSGGTSTNTTSSSKKKSFASRRKYTLEELEVEGFEPSSNTDSEPEKAFTDGDEDEDDLVDLNSLIEGAVDDEDDQSTVNMSSDRMSQSSRRTSQIERVDNLSSDESEQELLSLAVNQGSILSSNLVPEVEANLASHGVDDRPPQLPPKRRKSLNTPLVVGDRRLLPEKPIKMMFNGIGTDIHPVSRHFYQ